MPPNYRKLFVVLCVIVAVGVIWKIAEQDWSGLFRLGRSALISIIGVVICLKFVAPHVPTLRGRRNTGESDQMPLA